MEICLLGLIQLLYSHSIQYSLMSKSFSWKKLTQRFNEEGRLSDFMQDSVESELTDEEIEALHHLQLGREHLLRSRGALIEFHHELGRAMDHYEDAKDLFNEADREELAEELYDPTSKGPIEGMWSSELVEEITDFFFTEVLEVESEIRDELADGERHINEGQMERGRRERWYYNERPP